MKKTLVFLGKMSKCENNRKSLNIRRYKDNIRKLLVSKPHDSGLHNSRGGERAQMLLVAVL